LIRRNAEHAQHVLVAMSIALAALSAAPQAEAAGAPSVEDVKAAEGDFNRGREAYKGGDYVEAAEYFESADSHAPNERVLELSITSRERAGNLDRAATLAQYGLETYPNSEKLKRVGEPLVAKAKADLLEVTVECDEACSVLDGTRLMHGVPVTKRVVYLTPGDHSVRAAWSDDRTQSKPVTGAAGDHVDVSFTAPPIPVKPVEAASGRGDPTVDTGVDSRRGGLPPMYFWIGVGTTAVLGGITTWSGIDTVNNPGADAVKAACAGKGDACQEYKDGRSRQTRTNILLGATGVVGIATAVVGIFATNWAGSSAQKAERGEQKGLSVSPFVSYQNGATIGATGRF
jgi:hypothetical protein